MRDRAIDEIWQEYRNAVFRVDLDGAPQGTAFLIDGGGLLLTAGHVVVDAEGAQHGSSVLTHSDFPGREFSISEVVHLRKSGIDAALLVLADPSKLPPVLRPVELGLTLPEITSPVHSIGYGLEDRARTRQGKITTLVDLFLKPDEPTSRLGSLLVADMSTKPGDSGSPLFDRRGLAVGINVESYMGDTYGKFLPASLLKELLHRLKPSPRVLALDQSLRAGKLDYAEFLAQLRPSSNGLTNSELYAWAKRISGTPKAYSQASRAWMLCPLARALRQRQLDDLLQDLSPFRADATADLRREYALDLAALAEKNTRLRLTDRRAEVGKEMVRAYAWGGASWEDMLRNDDPATRRQAVYVLGMLSNRTPPPPGLKLAPGSAPPRAVSYKLLKASLRDSTDVWTRQEAAYALASSTWLNREQRTEVVALFSHSGLPLEARDRALTMVSAHAVGGIPNALPVMSAVLAVALILVSAVVVFRFVQAWTFADWRPAMTSPIQPWNLLTGVFAYLQDRIAAFLQKRF